MIICLSESTIHQINPISVCQDQLYICLSGSCNHISVCRDLFVRITIYICLSGSPYICMSGSVCQDHCLSGSVCQDHHNIISVFHCQDQPYICYSLSGSVCQDHHISVCQDQPYISLSGSTIYLFVRITIYMFVRITIYMFVRINHSYI